MSEIEQEIFEAMAKWMYFLQPFDRQLHDKVSDHDHVRGDYRGAAQDKCNLAPEERGWSPSCFITSGDRMTTSLHRHSNSSEGRISR